MKFFLDDVLQKVQIELKKTGRIFSMPDLKLIFEEYHKELKLKMLDGDQVQIPNFCIYTSKKRNKRRGWNFKEKKEMIIPERYEPITAFSKNFIKRIIEGE